MSVSERPGHPLDHPLVKYWPTALGCLVALVALLILYPKERTPSVSAPSGQPFSVPEVDPSADTQRQLLFPEQVKGPPASRPEHLPPPPEIERQEPQTRLKFEKVTRVAEKDLEAPATAPRPLTQDDPKVQSALSRLDIQVYPGKDQSSAEALRRFLSHNGLSFVQHDMEEAMTREKARRLGGSPQAVTIVVDGQVLHGYSQETLDEALSQAVEKRVAAEE